MTPPTRYRYAGGYNWCVGGVMTPPYSVIRELCDKSDFLLVILYSVVKDFARIFDISASIGYNILATGSDSRGCRLKSRR